MIVKTQKIWSILIALSIVIMLLPQIEVSASASETVEYQYYDETGNAEIGFADSYRLVTTAENAIWVDGWYVVDGKVNITNSVKVLGNVNLILKNGSILNAMSGIEVKSDNALTIYAQPTTNGDIPGKLVACGENYCAGIGGLQNDDCGSITIYGGTINATGGYTAAGIGGGSNGKGGNVIVYDGDVTAHGHDYAAGIGGGIEQSNNYFKVFGGQVTAYGGESCAGIGGGYNGKAGNIEICGGTVYAYGGINGAGIGNSKNTVVGGNVTVLKGALYAEGKNGTDGILASNINVIPDDGVTTIKVQNSNGTPVEGSPFITNANITSLINGISSIQIVTHIHEFNGKYRDNGNYTHSRQCSGCDIYGETTEHTYENGKCICGLIIPSYLYYDIEENVLKTGYCEKYTLVTNEDTIWTDGWYIVDGTHNITGTIQYEGNVHLILKDKSSLKINGRLEPKNFTEEEKAMGRTSEISIYAQSNMTRNTGKLELTNDSTDCFSCYDAIANIHGGKLSFTGNAGIFISSHGICNIYGGNVTAHGTSAAGIQCITGSKLNIAGGEVTAYSDNIGAGIGGGLKYDVGDITISGGKVTAYSKGNGAGIGSADNTSWVEQAEIGDITISGGEILAYSQGEGAGIGGGYGDDGTNVRISGGKVTAYSEENGAGIGGGRDGTFYEGEGGNVTINGGEVIAYSKGDGSGIGGGRKGVGGKVEVTGGTVTAYSQGNGAGIGGGYDDDGGEFTLRNGSVTAYSECDGAGIGGGSDGDGGKCNLYGGTLHAYSGGKGTAIGQGEDGDDGETTVGDNLIIIDNLTQKIAAVQFYKEWNSFFKASEIDISMIANKDYPVTYQKTSTNGLAVNYVCDDYKLFDFYTTNLTTGWYVMSGIGTTNILTPVIVSGDVNLILLNDSELNVLSNIIIKEGSKLTIYSQETDDGTTEGCLNVKNQSIFLQNQSGIHGKLVIYGGNVNTQGQKEKTGFAGDLEIYGGSLTAQGGEGAVGIGGGDKLWGGDIIIYSGNLTAIAGSGASRGIGPRIGTDCCKVTVQEGTTLLDAESFEPIPRPQSAIWNDALSEPRVSVKAVNRRYYLGYNEDKKSFEEMPCLLYSTISDDSVSWSDGWFVLGASNVTINDTVKVEGNVNLILEDGYTLNINGGIQIPNGSSLSVYAQSDKNIGQMFVTGQNSAAINGDLRIYGGSVNAIGGSDSEGICGHLTIYGGSVDATAGNGAYRAIGDESNTIINVVDIAALIDKATNEPIQKSDDLPWTYALNGSTVSFFTVYPQSYIEYSEDGKSFEEDICYLYSTIDANTTRLNDGWYVVKGKAVIDGAVSVMGNAYLILTDECNLTVSEGIRVDSGNTLTIYAQSEGEKSGKLIATGSDHCAGIGGGWNKNSGLITIHGGNITATGGNATNNGNSIIGGAAGIGGGEEGGVGDGLVIYGGNITAQGGTCSAGIGGGYGKQVFCGSVTIYGGKVKAYGGEYNNNAGGAGIGSGWYGYGDDVTIHGGDVEAVGGFGAAGIGGGMNGMGCILTINDGNVIAQGGYMASGIGSGVYGTAYDDGGQLIFNGGNLTAICGNNGAKSIGASVGGSADGEILINCDVGIKAGDDVDTATIIQPDAFINARNKYVEIKENLSNKISLNITDNVFKVITSGKDAGTGIVMVALYDRKNLNRLLDVKVFELANGDVPESTFTQSGYVKVFWWTDLETMTPLCNSAYGKIE